VSGELRLAPCYSPLTIHYSPLTIRQPVQRATRRDEVPSLGWLKMRVA